MAILSFDLRLIRLTVSQGMAYLHASRPQIIHRDLKPDNVMDSHGTAKLIDFTLSKVKEGSKVNTALGTERYMGREIVIACRYEPAPFWVHSQG